VIIEAPSRPGPAFTELVDLAAARVGGAAIAASDEFFAGKENLLRQERPVFDPHAYGDRGKIMDGWESRRSFGRVAGHSHDWCLIALGLPGTIRGIEIDTSFFRGNFPEWCAIDACAIDGDPSVETLLAASWAKIAETALAGDTSTFVAVEAAERFTHVRLRIFPDGGVARLRVHGIVRPDLARKVADFGVIDLAAVENGGSVVACNDAFFGSRHNLIMPGRSRNMGDGWETRRKRRDGHDWVVVKLGARGRIRAIEVDTNHFKGNFPESCWIEAIDAGEEDPLGRDDWFEVLPRTPLRGHTRHFFGRATQPGVPALSSTERPATHVRLSIRPDGGVSRLRVHGDLAQLGPGDLAEFGR
jgi:allantoicase